MQLAAKVVELAKLRVFLSVPSGAFGGVIGKGGATIKALQVSRGWARHARVCSCSCCMLLAGGVCE